MTLPNPVSLSVAATLVKKYFSVYKRHQRKYGEEMERNWKMIFFQAMKQVNQSMGIDYFRRCRIPGVMSIKAAEEIKRRSRVGPEFEDIRVGRLDDMLQMRCDSICDGPQLSAALYT